MRLQLQSVSHLFPGLEPFDKAMRQLVFMTFNGFLMDFRGLDP